MGGHTSSFLNEERINAYQECTKLTRSEILHVYSVYRDELEGADTLTHKVPIQKVRELSVLQNCPFRDRLIKLFSEDRTGALGFEDLLDLVAVFHPNGDVQGKATYAFRLFDGDSDGYLDKADLIRILSIFNGEPKRLDMTSSTVQDIADTILDEADFDGDHKLSYVEFEAIVAQSANFASHFSFHF
eukprot:m.356317 g.356317  ORF g.356317 m.356317 type:complete len:187 (+) comp17500_c0_seq1:118-678(+)